MARLNQDFGTDTVVPIPRYGDLETIGYGADNAVMRKAAQATPLRPMPLTVLAHGRPFAVPEGCPHDHESVPTVERAFRATRGTAYARNSTCATVQRARRSASGACAIPGTRDVAISPRPVTTSSGLPRSSS